MRFIRHVLNGCVMLSVFVAAVPLLGQQSETTDPPRPRIEGMAVNHLGGGVANATVTVSRDGRKLAETKTSATGEFTVEIDLHEACTILVEIRRDGYAPFKTETDFDPESPPYIDTELAGALGFRGTVLGRPKRTPLPGAAVQLSVQSKIIQGTSARDGTFSLVGVPPGPGRLEVTAEGFGREVLNVDVSPDSHPVTVELKQERRIIVVLTNDEQKPVSGATIELRTVGPHGPDLRTRQTDEQGRTEFPNIHFDTSEARARIFHPDLVQTLGFDHEIDVDPKEIRSEASVTAPRGARIRGRIVDAATGNPVHSARVIAGTPGQGFVPQAFTDFDGTYLLTGLPAGKHPVTVHHVDYAAQLSQANCAVGATSRLNLELTAGKPLGGTITDADGTPMPGCIIESALWRGYNTLSLRMFTDESGAFLFEHAPTDEIRFVVRTREGRTLARDIPLSAGKTDHAVTVEPSAAQPPGVALRAGKPAPALTLTALDGSKIDGKTLAGKFVFLDFWATWCGPCVAELPNLQKLYRAIKDRSDIHMISISLDQDETALRAFLEKNHMPWLQIFGENSGAADAADAYGVSAIPATFLIGPDGKILETDLRGPALLKRVLDQLSRNDSDTPREPALR